MDKHSGATISACGKYRYNLWRRWDYDKPVLAGCFLNPSTADAVQNDPTIVRFRTRARALGYGGIEVVNAFAFRSTDPDKLYDEIDPVGPENNLFILEAARRAGMFVCGWGKHDIITGLGRNRIVYDLIKSRGITPHILKLNKDGSPAHPLYLSYKLQPQPWGPIWAILR